MSAHSIGRRRRWFSERWGYLDDAQSVDCDCGEPQTMAHLLSCRLLDEACTADDLAMRPQVGEHCVKDTTEEEDYEYNCPLLIIVLIQTARPAKRMQ